MLLIGRGDPPSQAVRFASPRTTTSPPDTPQLPLAQTPTTVRSLSLPILAIVLLGVALWLEFLSSDHATFLPPVHGLASYILSCFHERTTELCPALKVEIQELVIATMHSQNLAARGLRMPDYALKANGGRIAKKLTSGDRNFLGFRTDNPDAAIDDDVHAGRCWKFSAFPSQIGVRLPRMIYPSHVSIDHLPQDVIIDMGQAPRNMTLWGVVDGKNNTKIFKSLLAANHYPDILARAPPIAKDFLWAPLVSFAYDIHDSDIVQTFHVSPEYKDNGISFGIMALEVLSNWGSDVTCLYRMRIHGGAAY